MTTPAHDASDRGESLVELLLAIAIMGLTVAALMGMLIMSSSTSVMHEEMTVTDRVINSWAERIEAAPYVLGATPTTLGVAPVEPGAPGGASIWTGAAPTWTAMISTEPGKSSQFVARVAAVRCWNTGTRTFDADCQSDAGLQQITLSVSGPGELLPATTRELVVTKRNPCTSITEPGCSR